MCIRDSLEGEPDVVPVRDGRELTLDAKRVRCLVLLVGREDVAADVDLAVEITQPDCGREEEGRNSGDNQERADCLTQLADLLRASIPQATTCLLYTSDAAD